MIKLFIIGALLLQAPFFNSNAQSSSEEKIKSPAEEREEFLRKFAKDPDAIKPAPKEEAPSEHHEKQDKNKLDFIIKKFQKVENADHAKKEGNQGHHENVSSDDGEDVKVTNTIDIEHLKKLQEIGGAGVDIKGLLEKMKAGSTGDGKAIQKELSKGSSDYSLLVYNILHVFRAQKESDVALFLKLKIEKSPLGVILNFIPGSQKIPYILARILRDEKALPNIAKIANERKKLFHYAIFVFMTFIFNFGIKRILQKNDESIFQGISSGIMRNMIIMIVRLCAFFVLFSQEFTPLWQVLKLAI